MTKTGIVAVPSLPPGGVTERTACKGGQACHGRVALMIKYF